MNLYIAPREARLLRALLLHASDTLSCMSLSEAFPWLGKINDKGEIDMNEEEALREALTNLLDKYFKEEYNL